MADDSFKRYIEEQLREQSFLEEAPMLPQSFHANSVHAQKLLDTGIAGIAAPIAGIGIIDSIRVLLYLLAMDFFIASTIL